MKRKMSEIGVGLIAIGVVMIGFFVLLIVELRKVAKSLKEWLEWLGRVEQLITPALEELKQTLRSFRNTSEGINDVTADIKTFSTALKNTGQSIKTINALIEGVRSFTVVEASGLRAGIRAAIDVLLNNLFKKGGKQ